MAEGERYVPYRDRHPRGTQPALPPVRAGLQPGTKVCPRCAEEVKQAAVVCRFCGYQFNGGGVARAGAGDGRPTGLVTLGYIFAVLIPVVGFVIGVVCAAGNKGRWATKNGIAIIVTSCIVFLIGLALILPAISHLRTEINRTVTEATQKLERENNEAAERAERETEKSPPGQPQ